jgi:serine phosphatase RsbU (regulator of sigma subunit)
MWVNEFVQTLLKSKHSEQITRKLKMEYAATLNNIGYYAQYHQGDVPKSLDYYNRSLKIKKEIGDKKGISTSLNNIGYIYQQQGDIPKALEYNHQSLKIKEQIDDKEGIAMSLNNIGGIHADQNDFDTALEYYYKCLEILKEIDDKRSVAITINNIALIYSKKGDLAKALKYNIQSLKIKEQIGDKEGIAMSLNNIGLIYKEMTYSDELLVQEKDSLLNKSLEHHIRGLKIQEEIGDKSGKIISLINIGYILITQKKIDSAEDYAQRSFELAKELGFHIHMQSAAEILSTIYEKQGKGMQALKMQKLYITMRDSINNEETQKATAQQQAKYEYEKQKAVDDAEHDKLLAIEQEEKKKQQILTVVTGVGLGLVIVFLIFVFNRLQVTKNQKLVIENQKIEVEQQKEVVELAHSELEEKNQEIMDSITYAKRIQSAILPPAKVVKEYLQDSFILYKPKDIVAGDFYWMEHKDDKVLFAAADCTGHGVPGAMVSVVCNNALNRSVREHGLTNPGEILNKTREIVVAEFRAGRQAGEKSDEGVKDGMDIALCSLEGNKLQYAGANNPLWIVRDCHTEPVEVLDNPSVSVFRQAQDDTLCILETKANKQPIGQFDNPLPYTTHTFELQKEDSIYIFSDGYVDQFGGEKGKKFKAKAFRELLLSIQDKTMEKQKTIIDNSFETWRGSLEQIDDVCVIGVKHV